MENIVSSDPGIFDQAASTVTDIQADPSVGRSVTFTGDDGTAVTVTYQPPQQ